MHLGNDGSGENRILLEPLHEKEAAYGHCGRSNEEVPAG